MFLPKNYYEGIDDPYELAAKIDCTIQFSQGANVNNPVPLSMNQYEWGFREIVKHQLTSNFYLRYLFTWGEATPILDIHDQCRLLLHKHFRVNHIARYLQYRTNNALPNITAMFMKPYETYETLLHEYGYGEYLDKVDQLPRRIGFISLTYQEWVEQGKPVASIPKKLLEVYQERLILVEQPQN